MSKYLEGLEVLRNIVGVEGQRQEVRGGLSVPRLLHYEVYFDTGLPDFANRRARDLCNFI